MKAGKRASKPDGHNLEAFKEALKEEYRRKSGEEKTAFEDEMAELTARSRVASEREVTRIRNTHREIYESKKEDIMLGAVSSFRKNVLKRMGSMFSEVEDHVSDRLEDIKKDRSIYKNMMGVLVERGAQAIGDSIVVCVHQGEAVFVPELEQVAEVRENLEGRWGGCVVSDAATEGRLLDMSFKTMWNIVSGETKIRFSKKLTQALEKVDELSRELRVS